MVDIHTHVLPGIDDGAKDTATSLAILRAEQEQGVDTVVLTSHFYGRKRSPRQFVEDRAEAFAHIQSQIPQGMRVMLGAEVHFSGVNMPEYEELCRLAIESTRYILIELPFACSWTKSLLDKLSEFMSETGYIPIIAHVERYREVRKKPALVSELANMGCLIQMNVGAVLNKAEKGLAFALFKHGLVHCLGSDAHDMENRAPKWALARKEVERAGYSKEWKKAEDIMMKIIAGGQVCVECQKPVKKILWKYV